MITTDGGSAFPHDPYRESPTGVGNLIAVHHGDYPGMSLLDYFAAKAMQGMLADHTTTHETTTGLAYVAFNYAEAMLKERERRAGHAQTNAQQSTAHGHPQIASDDVPGLALDSGEFIPASELNAAGGRP